MALVNMRDMLHHAYQNNYAVGAFDLVSLDFLEAVINAAERCRAPVILSIAEPYFIHFDPDLFFPAVEAAAKRASIPVAIQLDHASGVTSSTKAINQGCNGIMVDAAQRNLRENIQFTKGIVEMAHSCGVPVVGELGYVAGSEGEEAELHPGECALTNPAEAKTYIERTGVDFLAVSIGTVQGRVKGRAKLDFQRLKKLKEAANVPLVIHGGSGLNDDQFRKLPTLGVVKINYYTALSDVAAKKMRQQGKENPNGSFTDLKKGVKEAVADEVERCCKLWGSAGRAAEVLAQCRAWNSVEEQIHFNLISISSEEIARMLSSARSLLSQIPGVRDLFVGQSSSSKENYAYCWTIRFSGVEALQGSREHANFLSFRKKFLYSQACESVSSSYQEIS